MRAVLPSALVLAAAVWGGCGGDGDEDAPRPETATQPAEAPVRAAPPPAVPRGERAAAVAVVSRYADALARMDLERACSLLSPLALRDVGPGGCEAKLGSFARRTELLREPRTVPLWDRGTADAGRGVLRGRVKIGFPTEPTVRWTFTTVKEGQGPWRLRSALPTRRRL